MADVEILKQTERDPEVVGYARVSSLDQNLARQIEKLRAFPGMARIYKDKASGKNTDRPALKACLDRLTVRGDTLVVLSMDRLARSLHDLLDIVKKLTARGVKIIFLKDSEKPFDGSPQANLMLALLGAFAEFEREILKERQADGIKIAKEAGKYKGRSPKLTLEQQETVCLLHAEGTTVAEISRRYNISRQAVYRYLKRAKAS